jgi:membrane associated rhomboid family serine protease
MTGVNDPQPGDTGTSPRRDARAFRRALYASLGFVLLLWWIEVIEWWLGAGFGALGVRPGSIVGLIGVLLAPLLHGSWQHLAANSLPLIVLGTLALYAYPRATRKAAPVIWLGSGLIVWLIGRESLHIGASGLTHGLMLFLFLLGILRWEPRAIAVALVTFLLYGGMLLTVLPREVGGSWEYHLGGAAMGALAAALWRRRDPAPPKKKYSWELEEELARAAAARAGDEFELPRPHQVPVLWQRPEADSGPKVLPFPRGTRAPEIDDEPPTPRRH